jgi:phytoene dehydrogenase-like protein
MERKAYEALKEERCEFLFRAIERSIPDVRQRMIVRILGSPMTHMHFNRRYRGSYGPAYGAGKLKFPYPDTGIEGLYMCGDSVFPGIGVPAVAASGANAASSTVPIWKHLKLMKVLRKINQ